MTRAAALALRVLSMPVSWRRSRSIGKGNRRAPLLDQIDDLCDRRESFNPVEFWRIQASLWGRLGFKGVAKSCGERLRQLQNGTTASAGTPDHTERHTP